MSGTREVRKTLLRGAAAGEMSLAGRSPATRSLEVTLTLKLKFAVSVRLPDPENGRAPGPRIPGGKAAF